MTLRKLSKVKPKRELYEACFECREVFLNDVHTNSAVYCPTCGHSSIMTKYLSRNEAVRAISGLRTTDITRRIRDCQRATH